MSELDSSLDSADAGDAINDGDTNDADQTSGQTDASESQPAKSSESERIRGLQSAMGHKESEKQAALAERDAAIAQRDAHASALAALQAEYDAAMQGFEVEDVTSSAADLIAEDEAAGRVLGDEPMYAKALRENNGMAPSQPRAVPRPRMSEADAALREMEQIMSEHLAGFRN